MNPLIYLPFSPHIEAAVVAVTPTITSAPNGSLVVVGHRPPLKDHPPDPLQGIAISHEVIFPLAERTEKQDTPELSDVVIHVLSQQETPPLAGKERREEKAGDLIGKTGTLLKTAVRKLRWRRFDSQRSRRKGKALMSIKESKPSIAS